jgi:hypothetical protein
MKKVLSLLVAVLVMAGVSSCGGGSDTPSGITKSYLTAQKNNDFDKVVQIYVENQKNYTAPQTAEEKAKQKEESKALVAKMKAAAAEQESKAKEEGKDSKEYQKFQEGKIAKFKIVEETIAEDGATATVKAVVTNGLGEETESTFNFEKKDNGKWRLNQGK